MQSLFEIMTQTTCFLLFTLFFVYDHRIMIFVLAPAFLFTLENRMQVTRDLTAPTPEEQLRNEEGMRTIQGIMMQTVVAIVLGCFYTQYNYSTLNKERAKIKHQQVQLQSLFMNQPEGVLIYRDLDNTPEDDSAHEKRRQQYEQEGSWDNFGLDIVIRNQAIMDITGIEIDDGGILKDEVINERRFKLLDNDWLQTVAQHSTSKLTFTGDSTDGTHKSLRQIMKARPQGNELQLQYWQMRVDDKPENDRFLSITT